MLTPEQTRVDVRLRAALQSQTLPSELVVSGPAGTGKTYGILAVLHCLLADYQGLRFLICRKTRKALTESALVTYEQGILEADGMGSIASSCRRQQRDAYRYPNGSELVVAGIDDPEKIKSSDWDLIYANEATELSENDWEFLGSRLDRPGRTTRLGHLLGDCNPDSPHHWIKRRESDGTLELWVTLHEANPVMHDGANWTEQGTRYLERLERSLTGVRYQRLRRGVWAGAEGMVYDEWDDAVHLVDPAPIPPEWTRFRSIDFGYTNPFICQWWAQDPDGRLVLYRELYGTKRLVSDWAEDIKRLSEGERIEATVADHDAEDRATLAKAGIGTAAARKAVKPGIELVQQRLRKAGDGKPRLTVHKRCRANTADRDLLGGGKPTCTSDEFAGYVWAKAMDGRPEKEEPQKLGDHGMDAMRYLVAHVDRLGQYSAGAW
jgi:PBSX family phage terminase large subunit